MSRALNDLDSSFQLKAMELIARCIEVGTPVMIIDTLRTEAEQKKNLAKGVSWTFNSKHLPQPPEGKSKAIDICPWEQFNLHGADKLAWDADWEVWLLIGEIGERLGLRWGGRWKVRDLGHFEMAE